MQRIFNDKVAIMDVFGAPEVTDVNTLLNGEALFSSTVPEKGLRNRRKRDVADGTSPMYEFIERDRKDGYIPGELVKLLKLISQLQRRSASG
uniref:Uncharacterized protein n=1 Tax=Haemonchus contortus TaxID=6289 RepID=A0A7I5E6L1_HAECO